jgi:lipid A 3-O-deacylase
VVRNTLPFAVFVCVLLACSGLAGEVTSPPGYDVTPRSRPALNIWPNGIGNGLNTKANEVSFAMGPAVGVRVLGGLEIHDLVLARLDYARLRTGVIGGCCPLRGSLEGRLEGLVGVQFSPEGAFLIGFTPVLRYNVATGTRWMPFADVGAGLSLTDIGLPDLSTTLEFNLQVGGGCYYFVRDDLALGLQYRFLHISNNDMKRPNMGVNANVVYVGLSRYF